MKTKRVAWLLVGLTFAAGVVLLYPSSPAYLPELLAAHGQFDGPPASHWLPALNGAEPEQRYEAIFALGLLGPEAADAVPALAVILTDDPDPLARRHASLALVKIAPASAAAVPALALALEDRETLVRMNAALALFRLRQEARPAVPALIKAVGRPENRVYVNRFLLSTQAQMALALGRASAGTTDGVPTLKALLESAGNDELRRHTIRALGEVGPPARPVTPLLRPFLTHDNADVRLAAQTALEMIGTEPAETR